ncbi:hypothetical protein [Corynebacterium sp. p3-SID1194]|uniref:hypothetical protein n=1 Tax=Corynebacterium sp. p3-SID1194 TaxID=2916105 RepID=UPI0021A5F7AB|nr:hypothetical protein [Corynebacterium sp. p3-SID1194]MCT1450203.1 hypothetical protein [Corynebacterium sp. p3-SID1194]
MASRKRRRARRILDVDYDRKADRPETGRSAGDGERIVELDDALPEGDAAANYEEERPPHHGD